MSGCLRLILCDQLSHSLPIVQDANPNDDLFLIAEVREEVTHVKHHIKKIAFLFSAMRHFAEELEEKGFQVRYVKISDPKNTNCLLGEITRAIRDTACTHVCVTKPSEYRLSEEFSAWQQRLATPICIYSDNRFLCSKDQFQTWSKGKKQLRMEHFYREMRRRHNVLMQDGKPVGGKWNYDAQNRHKYGDSSPPIPEPDGFAPDGITKQVIRDVSLHFSTHFGDLEPFHYGVTQAQAKQVLESFIENRLPHFGDYQDAMLQDNDWLFHSHISLYLNCGLLLPSEAIQAAEMAYLEQKAPLNAVEGFIRQILGWREFVRGIYWLLMPEYQHKNFLSAKRKLPEFYWTGNTKMNCLKQCVKATKQHAYAHHIQRLMVLGNFALLAGLHPDEVNEWYLCVYADAYEWVELPNVTGMVLFADGGVLASKPYAASGAYINKMSDYCQHCQYKVKEKTGEDACPFNYLYWNFFIQNKDKLHNNPRLGMPYRTLANMSEEKQTIIVQDANAFLNDILNNHKTQK